MNFSFGQSPGCLRRALQGTVFLLCTLFTATVWADCARDYRSDKNSGIYIDDVVITGTSTLSSAQLQDFRSKLTGICGNDSTDDVEFFVREAFQNEGYYAARVNNLDIEVVDPLAHPKSIRLKADVSEGPLYKLGEVNLVGNHAFSAAELRNTLSFQSKQILRRTTMVNGLEEMRKLYWKNGFGDFLFIVQDEPNPGLSTVNLDVTIVEGPQYRMGKLVVLAKSDVVEQVQAAWGIPEGAAFDFNYPTEYLKTNSGLLPADFTQKDMMIIGNCPDASVEVWLVVDPALLTLHMPPTAKKCEETHNNTQ